MKLLMLNIEYEEEEEEVEGKKIVRFVFLVYVLKKIIMRVNYLDD